MALGLILSPYGRVPGSFPYEINQSGQGFRQLCPADPYYFQRGQYGYAPDSFLNGARGWLSRLRNFFRPKALGAIPTDAELGRMYSWYTPVGSGSIATSQGYYPSPWVPPAGGVQWYGPQVSLGDAIVPPAAAPTANGDDVLKVLTDHQQKMFRLSLVSSTAVAASAVFTMYRTYRLMQKEEKHMVALIHKEEKRVEGK